MVGAVVEGLLLMVIYGVGIVAGVIAVRVLFKWWRE